MNDQAIPVTSLPFSAFSPAPTLSIPDDLNDVATVVSGDGEDDDDLLSRCLRIISDEQCEQQRKEQPQQLEQPFEVGPSPQPQPSLLLYSVPPQVLPAQPLLVLARLPGHPHPVLVQHPAPVFQLVAPPPVARFAAQQNLVHEAAPRQQLQQQARTVISVQQDDDEEEEVVDDPDNDDDGEEKKKSRPPHCDICGREFHAERFLRLHVAEIHGGKRGRFTCGDCGQVYTRLRSLERHQNRHHLGGGNPPCKICRKRVVNFDLHYRKFHCKSKSVQAGGNTKRKKRKRNEDGQFEVEAKDPTSSCSAASFAAVAAAAANA
jgi:hypothetical protein